MSEETPHPLDPVFAPASVAVVGASADPTKRGYQILRALGEAGYRGTVYPVNPRGGSILGLPVYPSIAELPQAPDLAVVCTPAASAPEVLAACGELGIRAAVILAVGFRESGDAGRILEERVREAARRHGVRVVGPNTSGLLNLPLGLNLIGARGVRVGSLSFLVQSGNMALSLMNEVTRESRDGVCICAGLGNEVDVGFGESLEYLGGHPGTRAVVVYAEGIRDGRRFLRAAAQVARRKPVVLIKAARSEAGEAAARSHTGSVAGPYDRLRAGMAQAGIVELHRTDELLQVAATLAWQPPAAPGSAVAILSDGGGQGTLAADALSEMGIPLAVPGEETREGLRALLGPAASVANPVDLAGAADADPRIFGEALEVLAWDPQVGTVLVVGLFGGYGIRFAESLTEREVEAARHMVDVVRATGTGVVVHSMYAAHWSPPLELLGAAHVPVMDSLDVACRCVGELWHRGRFLATPEWLPAQEGSPDAAPAVIRRAREERRGVLNEPEARELLEHALLTFPPSTLCRTADEAVEAVRRWGAPVALKVVSPLVPHKTDAGGVALGVGPETVPTEFRTVVERTGRWLEARGLPPRVDGVLVAPMQPRPLVELLVGAYRDPDVGPVLSLGAGGIWVEVLGDVAHRVLPVTEAEVRSMLSELRVGGVLAGGRGRAPGDTESVVRAVMAVARTILEVRDVAEVEVNPLFVYPTGAVPLDARVYLTASPSS